jgi:hypothetical protein
MATTQFWIGVPCGSTRRDARDAAVSSQ